MRRASLLIAIVFIINSVVGAPLYALETTLPEVTTSHVSEAAVIPATAPTPMPVVAEPPAVLPVGEMIITGYRIVDGQVSYVEIYNKSADIIRLDSWQLNITVTQDAKTLTVTQQLRGYALPKKHCMLARDGATTGRDMAITLPNDLPQIHQLTLSVPNIYETPTKTMTFVEGVAYNLRTTASGAYTTTNEFLTSGATPLFGGLYAPPAASSLRIYEVFANVRACGPGEDAADCREYVKLCNAGKNSVVLDAYRLRLGAVNSAASISNSIILAGTLAAGQCRSIDARNDGQWLDVPSSGYAWLADWYEVMNYAETSVSYAEINQTNHDGEAWGYDPHDASWKWSLPTPMANNNIFVTASKPRAAPSELVPCKEGQYRSLETGRCRAIVTADAKTPCRDNQYRSEETGRCRSITASVAVAKPCAEDQFRNPETGRCKQIASTDDLAPCKPGQERNPETNRCRTIPVSAMPKADFALQPTVGVVAQTFGAWWALGGLTLVAVAYGAWEWREELGGMMRRVRSNFIARGK